jgi:hypothetical protein
MILYVSYVCLLYSRFVENQPIDLEAMNPSFLRWFCHMVISRWNCINSILHSILPVMINKTIPEYKREVDNY